MGYTHYFKFKSIHGVTDKVENLYQKAIKDCNALILSYYKENKGTDFSLSGYSAHCSGKYAGIELNGKGPLAHETFILRERYKENNDFEFCKTARKPYDIVVVGCLTILKYHLKEYIEVSSDGDFEDWADGVNFSKKIFPKYNLFNPLFKRLGVENE